jgi:hypothetical protein
MTRIFLILRCFLALTYFLASIIFIGFPAIVFVTFLTIYTHDSHLLQNADYQRLMVETLVNIWFVITGILCNLTAASILANKWTHISIPVSVFIVLVDLIFVSIYMPTYFRIY